MTDGGGFRDVAGGLVLQLSGQSFAARALIGSLLAALLATTAVRLGWVRSRRARRGLVLAPIATAGTALIASAGDAFLPSLVVPYANGIEQLEFFNHSYNVDSLGWLLIAYTGISSFLLLRRGLSHLAIQAYVRRARPADDPELLAVVRRLSSKLRISAPPVLLTPDCPGGAFTAGMRHPVVCVDPSLVTSLDDRELEGLFAHELAHIARRDVAQNMAIGVLRDLTFFVAPLHLAARWLRLEQEHAADDMASDSTGRPAALASSILKVWEGSTRRGGPAMASMACATMVPAFLPVPAGMPSRILRQGGLRGGAKLIAQRVVRLIEGEDRPTIARERTEMVLLAVVLVALSAVTVVLPTQLISEPVVFGQWARPVAAPVPAPAMETFRALAPAGTTAFGIATATAIGADRCVDCLSRETAADWRTGMVAPAVDRPGGWASQDYIWQDGSPSLRTPRAEPLFGVDARNVWFGVARIR